MANHKSAAKRARQAVRKEKVNSAVKSTLKTYERRFRKSVSEKNEDQSKTMFVELVSRLDKAASKGVIHPRKASRKIGRISSLMNTAFKA